ncbi:MAG: peptide chain release factor N(5)-glutamine methyltransferase [Bacteroidota bacterium]
MSEIESIGDELIAGVPVQYLTGVAHFYDFQYFVNRHVLIPRPETEELVHWILSDHKVDRSQKDVLDIGTGSGCILLSLKKKHPTFRIFGIESSMDAYNVTRINAKRHRLQMQGYRFDFLDQDVWSELGKWNIIVSNPPYIAASEIDVMDQGVKQHEPAEALFALEDPLIFYRSIIAFSEDHLHDNGLIYVEINQYLSEETAHLFIDAGFRIDLREDMQGNPRMIKAWRS